MKNLTARTVQGVSWNLVATAVNTILQIAYTAIMARLLTPSDFGLMAMAMVIIKFGDYFSKMGMAHAIVQKPDLSNADIRSVFTSSVIMGLFFSSIMYFSAPLFQHVFDNEHVIPVIKALSINFLLKGLSITSLGLLGKELEFKKLALIDIATFIVCNMGIGIYLAYGDYGVFSLVYAGIAQQILMLTISFILAKHDIRPLFNWKVYKPLLSFGSKQSLISILEYIASSLDTFMIARYYGAITVGLYNKARMLVVLPTYKLTVSVSKVMFPAFSKIQDNKKKLGSAYLSTITLISALLFPICLGVFSASREIVVVILGDQWTDAIPILQILTFAIPFSLTSHFGGILCDATANLNIKFYYQVGYVVFLSSLFYIFRDYDFLVYPTIILVAVFIKNIGYAYLASRITGIKHLTIIGSYIPGILIGIAVGFSIYLVTELSYMLELSNLVILILQVFTGSLFLIIFGLLFPHKKLKKVMIDSFKNIGAANKLLLKVRWYRSSIQTR